MEERTREPETKHESATTARVRTLEHWLRGQLIWCGFSGASFEAQVSEGIKCMPGASAAQVRRATQANEDEATAPRGVAVVGAIVLRHSYSGGAADV